MSKLVVYCLMDFGGLHDFVRSAGKEPTMSFDIQKATIWKRVSAWLCDLIVLGIFTVGIAFLLSAVLGYDNYNQTLSDAYASYEAEYGITFELTAEEYEALTETELQRYSEAYDALINDGEAMYAYNMVINLTLVILTVSILLAYAVLEFVVPLLLGNGQTLGKKVFGICLMRTDGVKVTTLQLFVRGILGKYTVETMIPVLIIVMLYFNTVGITGTIVLFLIALLQVILICATRNNSAIHDLLSGTVAVDFASQKIFDSTEDLVEYKKKIHAERAARSDY